MKRFSSVAARPTMNRFIADSTASHTPSAATAARSTARGRLVVVGVIRWTSGLRRHGGPARLRRRERVRGEPLREDVHQHHSGDRPRDREHSDQQALAHAHVAVAALAPGAGRGDRDDRQQRGRLRVDLPEGPWLADVGFGVEPPARRFGLEFIPLETERYLLLCDAQALQGPRLGQMLLLLRSEAFRAAVDQLPGYDGQGIGTVVEVDALLKGPKRRRP